MRKLLAAAVFALAACSDSTGPDAHVGSYELRNINGQGLPQIIQQDASGTLEITGGLVTLRADGTFTDRIDYRFDDGVDFISESEVTTGFYTIAGNNVTFDTDDGFTYSMALSGRTLTQVEPGITLVYRR
jgi:hypothetical protein